MKFDFKKVQDFGNFELSAMQMPFFQESRGTKTILWNMEHKGNILFVVVGTPWEGSQNVFALGAGLLIGSKTVLEQNL